MKIALNGRNVGNGDIAVYFQNKAYFTKRGLNKRTVLHELYHHLACTNDVEIPQKTKGKAANKFVRNFLNRKSVHA